jgi:hypothetical protein
MKRAFVSCLLFASLAAADEGMWTFDNLPVQLIQQRYGFTPTRQWLDHVRLAAVRFNDGGSGSFISPTGLVLTNHHVAMGQLQKISTPQKDYVTDGFYARTQAEEVQAPDLELNVLMSLETVTERVQSAATPGLSQEEALKARKAEIARIQKESLDKTGLRSDVIPLYQGGEYWLYRYKKYTDVRLVFAPEKQAAFFGGDPDNFTYPRYCLDMAVFRVYENGKPLNSRDYLKWNPKGAADGELVFAAGNPGSSDRLRTIAQLETRRDYYYSYVLGSVKQWLAALHRYAAQGPEQERQASDQIYDLENTVKAFIGEYKGLQDPKVMAKKQAEETDFRQRVADNPQWSREYGNAWEQIAEAERKYRENFKQMRLRSIHGPELAGTAIEIVQYVAEVAKPDTQRLNGYHDSQLESLRFELFSPAPVYPAMEEALLANSLEESLAGLGPEDPFVKAALDGRTPEQVAKETMGRTRLTDPAFRKALVEGGEKAVAASTDPLVQFARRIDPIIRQRIKWYEDNVESMETAAGEKIGRARFAVYGKSLYPDGTFTLRLTYGAVKGYPMNGTIAPPKTTLYGLYDRAAGFDGKAPFNLTPRFVQRRERLELATPFDFVATLDVIGGNSGSPVINRNAELVGLVFDGNIESLVGNFVYNEEDNRTIMVHPAAMIEALRKLYDAGPLADEIQAGK